MTQEEPICCRKRSQMRVKVKEDRNGVHKVFSNKWYNAVCSIDDYL